MCILPVRIPLIKLLASTSAIATSSAATIYANTCSISITTNDTSRFDMFNHANFPRYSYHTSSILPTNKYKKLTYYISNL
jgi:hypothetical protein